MYDLITYLNRIELIDALFIGLIAIIIQKILIFIYTIINNAIFTHRNFTISGIWLASFISYEKDKHNYELVRIIQDPHENIKLYIEQYNNTTNNVLKLLGKGIFRGSKFSSVYYPIDKSDIRNGALLLRTAFSPSTAVYLTGKYAEFESTKMNDTLHISEESYDLKKIKLPFFKNIKIRLHIQCFKNYPEIDTFIKENLRETKI